MFLEPLGVQRPYVPHFKGLISGKVEPEAQGHDSTFTFCHAHLKKAMKNGLFFPPLYIQLLKTILGRLLFYGVK